MEAAELQFHMDQPPVTALFIHSFHVRHMLEGQGPRPTAPRLQVPELLLQAQTPGPPSFHGLFECSEVGVRPGSGVRVRA